MKRKTANTPKENASNKGTQKQLIAVLKDLEDEVEKQNSWRQVFMRGALYGLGTVIGATFLLALLGSIIALTVETLGISDIPFIGDFIKESVLEELQSK